MILSCARWPCVNVQPRYCLFGCDVEAQLVPWVPGPTARCAVAAAVAAIVLRVQVVTGAGCLSTLSPPEYPPRN